MGPAIKRAYPPFYEELYVTGTWPARFYEQRLSCEEVRFWLERNVVVGLWRVSTVEVGLLDKNDFQ